MAELCNCIRQLCASALCRLVQFIASQVLDASLLVLHLISLFEYMTFDLPIDRDAHLALTGDKYTDDNIFGVPAEGGETEHHVSAFEAPIEKDETSSLKDEETRSRRSSLSTISDSISAIPTHARKAVKKSHKAVKSTVGLASQSGNRGPEWIKAKMGLPHLHEKDASVLKEVLGGKSFFTPRLVKSH